MLLAALDLLEAEKKILEEDGPAGGLDARRRSLRNASLATLLLCPVIGSLAGHSANKSTLPASEMLHGRQTDRQTYRSRSNFADDFSAQGVPLYPHIAVRSRRVAV
jgi:hypothetical protein